MAMSLDAAASTMREAMHETVRRYSLLYLVQGILMVVTGVLALIYPWIASIAIVRLLGWFLIISGIFQGIGVIGARQVPLLLVGADLRCPRNCHWPVATTQYRRGVALLQRAVDRLFHGRGDREGHLRANY